MIIKTFLKKNRPTNHQLVGFTLIEITVVVAIIAVISAISIPIYKQLSPNIVLNATTRDIASDLRYAQQLAVTEQVNYQVVFDPISNSYQIKNSETSAILKAVALDTRVAIYAINDLTDNTVNFNVTGAATESGTILFNGQSYHVITIIEIKPSGYVKVIK
jgi:prepilin-type N-terminal cleavage/methylation domain-containing protein